MPQHALPPNKNLFLFCIKKNDADTIFFWKTIVLNENDEVYLITENGVNEGKVKKSKRKVTKAGREQLIYLKKYSKLPKKNGKIK